MTENMRERVERAVEMSQGNLTIEFAKSAIEMKKRQIAHWENSHAYDVKRYCEMLRDEIAYFEAVIEYLTERAAAEAVTETVEALAAIVIVANKVKAVRRAVTTLANKLHKLNYSLSDAFKRAWAFIRAFTGLFPLWSKHLPTF